MRTHTVIWNITGMDLGYSDSDDDNDVGDVGVEEPVICEVIHDKNSLFSSLPPPKNDSSVSKGLFSSLPAPKNDPVLVKEAEEPEEPQKEDHTSEPDEETKPAVRPPPGMIHKSLRKPQTPPETPKLTAEVLKTMINPHDRNLMKELDNVDIVEVVPFQREIVEESTQDEIHRLGSIATTLNASSKGKSLLTSQVSRVARKRHHINSMAIDAAANELEILDKQRKSAQIRKISSARYGW